MSAAPRPRRRVLLVGGSSEIGLAIMRALARDTDRGRAREAVLAGRDHARLAAAAQALRDDGYERVETVAVDALATEAHGDAIDAAFAALGGIDLAVLAVGVLGTAQAPDPARRDVDEAVEVLAVNFLGSGSLLLRIAERMRVQSHGTIVVLSTVAGERPRKSNPAYGASKQGLDGLAQALGDGLAPSGVRIVIVRPGFVRGRMTAGLKPLPLATTPERVAEAAVAAIDAGGQVVWVPPLLRPLMAVVRHLPRRVFARIAT